MATKKKKTKTTKARQAARVKMTATKKPATKLAARKSTKKTAPAAKVVAKKKVAKKTFRSAPAKQAATSKQLKRNHQRSSPAFSRESAASRSAGQAGDLQGLSDVEGADSESVDELLEEGNAFEAGVVEGVEEAGDEEGSEVHTREVPEDDVPGEYLDND